MKYLSLLVLLLSGLCHATDTLPRATHELLVADSGKHRLAKYDATGKLVWEYNNIYCYDMQQLDSGNILFCDEKNHQQKVSFIRELTPDKKIVWEHKSPGEVYSCQRTPDGTTVIGECSTGRIVEVSKCGKVLHSIKMTFKRGGHGAVRIVRKTRKGTYIAAHLSDRKIREYDVNGKVLREIQLKFSPFGVSELENGHLLASTEHGVYEFNDDNKLVWSLEQKDLPNLKLHWLTSAKRLSNGNTMICNWLGHGGKKNFTPIFEVTPCKKVVAKYSDTTQTKAIATAEILRPTLNLFIMAGQSNMQGWQGDAAKYPADTENLDKKIPFFWFTPRHSSSQGKWTHLQKQGGRFKNGHFGPEITFARALKKGGYNPAIFKYSLGGTSIAENWLAPGKGGLYDQMIVALKQAIKKLQEKGNRVNIGGFVWIQGESDAANKQMAKAFKSRLKTLIADLRQKLNAPQMPVLLGVDEQHPWVVKLPIIVTSQKEIAKADPFITFTTMRGFKKADSTHLTPHALQAHGKSLFKAFKALTSKQ